MKLEEGEYEVAAMDGTIDGCDLTTSVEDSIGAAKRHARRMLTDDELLTAGLVKVEVRNHHGECVADFILRGR